MLICSQHLQITNKQKLCTVIICIYACLFAMKEKFVKQMNTILNKIFVEIDLST